MKEERRAGETQREYLYRVGAYLDAFELVTAVSGLHEALREGFEESAVIYARWCAHCLGRMERKAHRHAQEWEMGE